MLYDSSHLYLNGESFRIGGRDAQLMRRLADTRRLDATACARLSAAAQHVVLGWLDDGWLQPGDSP
jgi:50S ribosomal protein L16 3-hydroxylase